ncbi:MAG: hypothetical protein A2383_02660 [Candidatus Pacebacteria bacterium RIFOXYB1_FULL_39_46]|nr:MAG: hypothetical protein A2383_02660 [Candidatus Pacebacteria bacterium RIFOXYB1_FULL_39_46]OGJ39284.1 MAG: hypothetical protein A2182_02925 [Candidatus Pacebacteria bacterium RIFOXYA1_FULL_38_18]OGJ40964.1 MAG: hypothetical protein A2582_01585 [Candidatus Pacebacteria bacterium RIFOXYD1_FULL_39_27]OGJ41145.1 MAG: hypothetical protein A2411_01505 [Candidatus Pacebacteria bacterium RIFOXYC1_FULL_39_21]
MFKKLRLQSLFLTYAWLLLTAGMILISIAGVHYSDLVQRKMFAFQEELESEPVETLAGTGLNNPDVRGVQTIVENQDARTVIVANFLKRYNSPMTPYDYYAQRLVEIADNYNLDFRLLPAIAMRESELCKKTHSGAPHNCLGFGIHSDGTLDFASYEEGFERAAKELRAYYVDQGRITTEMVGQKYASSETWADGVNQFMAEMRYDDRALGRELKEDDTNVLEFAQ